MRIKIVNSITVLLFLIFFFPYKVFSLSPEADSSPAFLTAISDQDQRVPLYWFKPGIAPLEQVFDDGTKESQIRVSEQWYENCVAEKFLFSSSPFVLLKSRIFISFLSTPNDTASFFVTINRNDRGKPGVSFSEPVYARVVTNGNSEGQWVEIEHNLLIPQGDTFWVVFHWLKDSPTFPLVGVDYSPRNGRSYQGWKKDGYWQWNELSNNLMIRCLILANDMHTSLLPNGYNLYRGDSANFPISPIFLLKSFPADSFYYLDYQVNNGESYYYKLTALYSGQDTLASHETQATPRAGALLKIDVDSLEVSLIPGEKKERHLQLTNAGGLPLDYRIEFDLSLDDSTKGTDTYGYTWTDDLTRNSLRYQWVDISQRGVLINISTDRDAVYGPITLNFPFPFYGNNYDSLWVLTNGVLSFYPWDLRFVNYSLPYAQGYFRLIAPLWSNLTLNQSSKMYLLQSSDSLIVSFAGVENFKTESLYIFQVILTKQGSIDFQYERLPQSDSESTVGIQNEDGTSALLISYNQPYLQDSLRARINPPHLFISPMEGTIASGETQSLKLLFDGQFLSSGLYKGNLNIYAQDKNHTLTPVSIPVVLNLDTTTSVQENSLEIPFDFRLGQNYPNPFNPSTTIPFEAGSREQVARSPVHTARGKVVDGSRFMVDRSVHTTLKIYNVLGQLVKTLVDEEKSPGNYQVVWDGKDQKGNDVSSGIYFYQLRIGDYRETRKMSLLR